jgi:hypothetical protein
MCILSRLCLCQNCTRLYILLTQRNTKHKQNDTMNAEDVFTDDVLLCARASSQICFHAAACCDFTHRPKLLSTEIDRNEKYQVLVSVFEKKQAYH